MDPKLKKWLEWMAVIMTELQELMVAKHTFHGVQSIIQANPALRQPSLFYDYFAQSYVSHVVIGVRRQVKSHKQSISLARLLQELIDSPQSIPRTYYVSLYEGYVAEPLANSDFDKFSKPGSPHIDPALAEADLKQLKDVSAKCEEFADKRVAHRDTREPKDLPTFNDVDACVDLLDTHYVKYYHLFHADTMDSLLPTWQYDWTAIFRVPWIPTNGKDD